MYLAVSDYVVGAILFRQALKDRQKPIDYISKVLVDAETCYSQVKQTTLALCIAAKKLCPYFQTHQMTILTNQPLRARTKISSIYCVSEKVDTIYK